MGLLDWLDPTRQWSVVDGPAPDLNRVLLQFESLRFGDPLDSARFLGRPDQLQWRSRIQKDFDLLYARKGLRLGFTKGRLTVVAFLVGPGSSDHPAFSPAKPLAPDGTRLTPQVDRDHIVALFGKPDPSGSDEEVVQVFHSQGVVSDFFLDEKGCLKEWALYPDD